ASACLLEGSIAIIVDNSPAVMILPTSLFSILEDANDYYFPPITGTYLRFTRLGTAIAALFATPLFLLFLNHPGYLPESWHFLLLKDDYNIPPLVQMLILEFAIDGLKMASINTPNMLTTTLSIVAGIVFGDYTVSSGLFNPEIMLYMAFVAVANYTQSNMELGYAIKFHRMILLVLTGFFDLPGFIVGTVFLVFMLVANRTFVGRGYLYPLIPFNGKQFLKRFFRVTFAYNEKEQKESS
ncbi:MAG: spore germination protein, partial [Lachnospiraceae bacterium]|nr:spore germination protein [Lachnospiraceae bacterium]